MHFGQHVAAIVTENALTRDSHDTSVQTLTRQAKDVRRCDLQLTGRKRQKSICKKGGENNVNSKRTASDAQT